MLRKWIPDKNLGYEFSGTCELLSDEGECGVITQVRKQGTMRQLEQIAGVKGICDFPHFRIDDIPVEF
jgi:hypothetical protein